MLEVSLIAFIILIISILVILIASILVILIIRVPILNRRNIKKK